MIMEGERREIFKHFSERSVLDHFHIMMRCNLRNLAVFLYLIYDSNMSKAFQIS